MKIAVASMSSHRKLPLYFDRSPDSVLENENCEECDLLRGVVNTLISSDGWLHRYGALPHATTDTLCSVFAPSPSAMQTVGSHGLVVDRCLIEAAVNRSLYVYLPFVSSLDFVKASVKADELRFVEWSEDGAKRGIRGTCVCKKTEFPLVFLVAKHTKASLLI